MAMTVLVPVAVPMAMTMMAAAKEPDTREVDQQADDRDWNCFIEMDRHRRKET